MVIKTEAAKEREEQTKVPKLGINKTSQEWEKWRSSWARYKLVSAHRLSDPQEDHYRGMHCPETGQSRLWQGIIGDSVTHFVSL